MADPSGDCDGKTSAFAKKHASEKIEFTGKVTSVAPHNDDTYVVDVLVNVGVNGPNFKFSGVETDPGGPVPPKIGLPVSSDPLRQGDRVRLVAQIDEFNQAQCLLYLSPVSAKILH